LRSLPDRARTSGHQTNIRETRRERPASPLRRTPLRSAMTGLRRHQPSEAGHLRLLARPAHRSQPLDFDHQSRGVVPDDRSAHFRPRLRAAGKLADRLRRGSSFAPAPPGTTGGVRSRATATAGSPPEAPGRPQGPRLHPRGRSAAHGPPEGLGGPFRVYERRRRHSPLMMPSPGGPLVGPSASAIGTTSGSLLIRRAVLSWGTMRSKR